MFANVLPNSKGLGVYLKGLAYVKNSDRERDHLSIHSKYMYSFNTYLFSIYYVPDGIPVQ